MPKRTRSPYDVKLSQEQLDELGVWLSDHIENAIAANATRSAEIAYYHTLYEQGRTRSARNSPWPDAADLTSPIGTEKVDALRSRIVRTIFSEQVYTVEGYGAAAEKAPFVEEFHQWQLEAEGFQRVFAETAHLSLLEPYGVMEVYEDAIRRPIRRTIHAALTLNPMDGSVMVGANLQPQLEVGQDGKYVEVPTEEQTDPATGMPIQPVPSAEVVIDDYELVAHGPRERAIPYRDYIQLPLQAKERRDLWLYGKRFYRRIDELLERVTQGIYDREAVDELGTDDEQASDTTLAGDIQPVVAQEDTVAQKELWELTCLADLALVLRKNPWNLKQPTELRWYVVTLSRDKRKILRLQYDDIGKPRYFKIIPFPKPNSCEGYVFIGNKLITVIEENTAWRNMLTDRASLQVQAPMGRLQGALWDPDDQPLGPKQVLTMRQRDEVFAIELPDYTAPARERIIDTERQAEKLAGMSDIASGSQPTEDRTLGETQLVAVNSEVRIDEVIRNIQEPLEEIAQVRHLMWIRALKEMGNGMELPPTVLQGLETRGMDVSTMLPDKAMTATMLEGVFRFKPKGSVESADKPRQQQLFAQGMQALAAIAQANPMIGLILQQPKVAKALIERWIYLYGGGLDKSAFLGAEAMALLQQQMQVPGMMPGLPMMPNGPTPPQIGGPPEMGAA